MSNVRRLCQLICLCPSKFFFLNLSSFFHSSAKESAVFSDQSTCERDKKTWTQYQDATKELEEQMNDLEATRVAFETQVSNVDSLPTLAEDHARLVEVEEQARLLHQAYDEKKAKASKKYRDKITKIEEEIGRLGASLITECKHVVIQGDTMEANDNRLEDSLAALEIAHDFVYGFSYLHEPQSLFL